MILQRVRDPSAFLKKKFQNPSKDHLHPFLYTFGDVTAGFCPPRNPTHILCHDTVFDALLDRRVDSRRHLLAEMAGQYGTRLPEKRYSGKPVKFIGIDFRQPENALECTGLQFIMVWNYGADFAISSYF